MDDPALPPGDVLQWAPGADGLDHEPFMEKPTA